MIFSFALFSSVALLSSVAAQGVVHQVTVGNDTGGTIYNPTNIVSRLICYPGYTVVLTVSFPERGERRYCHIHFLSQKSHRDPVQLC